MVIKILFSVRFLPGRYELYLRHIAKLNNDICTGTNNKLINKYSWFKNVFIIIRGKYKIRI